MSNDPPRPLPRPLSPAECEPIWRWERAMIAICGGSAVILAAILAMGWLSGNQSVTRGLIVAWFVGLIIAGIVAPLRERCPRCGKRLSNMWKFQLPESCRGCGVAFPRPKT